MKLNKLLSGQPKPDSQLQVVRALGTQNGAANEPELWLLGKHQCGDRALTTHLRILVHKASACYSLGSKNEHKLWLVLWPKVIQVNRVVHQIRGFPTDTSDVRARQLVKVLHKKASKHGGPHVHFVHGCLNLLGVENGCQCLWQHLVPEVLGGSILQGKAKLFSNNGQVGG